MGLTRNVGVVVAVSHVDWPGSVIYMAGSFRLSSGRHRGANQLLKI